MNRPFLLLLSPAEMLDLSQQQHFFAEAYKRAIREVCGWPVSSLGQTDGHTSYTLLCSLFADSDRQLTEEIYEQLGDAMRRHVLAGCPHLEALLRPGLTSTLRRLVLDGQAICVPYTGLFAPVGKLVFERANFAELVNSPLATFGGWQRTYPDLIDAARASASAAGAEMPWPAQLTVVLSGAKPTTLAARSLGVRTISVGRADVDADARIDAVDQLPGVLAHWSAFS